VHLKADPKVVFVVTREPLPVRLIHFKQPFLIRAPIINIPRAILLPIFFFVVEFFSFFFRAPIINIPRAILLPTCECVCVYLCVCVSMGVGVYMLYIFNIIYIVA